MKKSSKEIERTKDYPIGVFHCSPTNSTHFTNCCKVAITSYENCCPNCGFYVIGWNSNNKDNIRFKYAFKKDSWLYNAVCYNKLRGVYV